MKTKHSFYNMYRTAGDERERESELAVVWPNNMCLPACLLWLPNGESRNGGFWVQF